MDVEFFLDLFVREHYQTYYIPIAKFFKSIEASIMFSEFSQRYKYHKSRNELIDIPGHGEGWFYHTRETIEERTAINKRQLDNAISILKEHKILETVNYGLPCRKYYRLNLSGIAEFSNNFSSLHTLFKLDSTHCSDRSEQSVQPYNKDKEPKEEPKKEKTRNAPSDLAVSLSSFLLEQIKIIQPDFKKFNLKKWANDFDILLKERECPERIKKLIVWVMSDEFWKKNIQSPNSLRNHFDRLEISMNSKSQKSVQQIQKEKIEEAESVTERATKNKYLFKNEYKEKFDFFKKNSIKVFDNFQCVEFINANNDELLKKIYFIDKDFSKKFMLFQQNYLK